MLIIWSKQAWHWLTGYPAVQHSFWRELAFLLKSRPSHSLVCCLLIHRHHVFCCCGVRVLMFITVPHTLTEKIQPLSLPQMMISLPQLLPCNSACGLLHSLNLHQSNFVLWQTELCSWGGSMNSKLEILTKSEYPQAVETYSLYHSNAFGDNGTWSGQASELVTS